MKDKDAFNKQQQIPLKKKPDEMRKPLEPFTIQKPLKENWKQEKEKKK